MRRSLDVRTCSARVSLPSLTSTVFCCATPAQLYSYYHVSHTNPIRRRRFVDLHLYLGTFTDLLKAFNHGPSSNAEQEYDRLRDAARQEQAQHQHFAAEARQAYERGDGGRAHEMSTQSKNHAAKADQLNKQASEFIFRENNAVGKVAGDTIDLHGQFVEEVSRYDRDKSIWPAIGFSHDQSMFRVLDPS